ncbi:MAG TPA: sigma 54-interacting transcriptional regulator [Streptosporangiaceae bacterium]|nr:sigma 54-interacting transcriptional regulator [Streptosporangiaceae bacterium]
MDIRPQDPSAPSGPTRPDPDLLPCLAAVGRALAGEFDPRAFLDDLSAELRPLLPHDRLGIGYLADDRRTFSVFAEHGAPGFLPPTDRYTTHLERPARFPVAGSPLAAVFDGEVLCVSHLLTDPRFVPRAPQLRAAGLRSAIFVPLLTGSRVIGELSAASRVTDAYQAVHVERMCSVGRLLAPFIELIALLYRERRRRLRVGLLKDIMPMLGTTLDVRQVLAPLGDAIRPALDFDAMGVITFQSGSPDLVLFATVGEPPAAGVEGRSTTDYSFGEAVKAGRPVLVHEAAMELDPTRAGDRAVLAGGLQSCLVVPMHFGDEIGGALFFGKHEPHWYDGVDVEVATAVASQMVLGIQHQRLAEEQRRLASVERRARTLEQSLKSARSELHQRYGFDQILGRSPLLREALARAAQVARTEASVLLTGESGTGKELVARAIHHASPRSEGPFVAVNCAALPDTLLESELFGHERGAFTGADRQKPGRFELAAGGTLFLDEIGDLSAAVQVKLLRVLQEREYQRVGGTVTLKADVRLIAATNRDLSAEMAAGRFRSDLFYRLSVFGVHLPPLRERGDDVLLLADHFIRTLGPQMGKADLTLSRDACELLRRHSWPGNIRELQNAIERALITSEGTLITAAHLAIPSGSQPAAPPPQAAPPPPAGATGSLQDLERAAIIEALQRTHGQKSRAAALLGLTRFQLYTRLKRYHIDPTQL